MNRRELFRYLPLSLLTLPAAVTAGMAPEKPAEEPSPWAEYTCKHTAYDYRKDPPQVMYECHTHFKAIRGTMPICPACGSAYATSGKEDRDKVYGIEVK